MSMIGNLRAVDDATISALLANPEAVQDFVHPEKEEEDAEHLDIDKTWHTIHYVFTGATWDGDFPLGFLVSCGTPIGEEDVGYGPARAFRSVEVKQLATAIAAIDEATFRKRFSVERLTKAEIYPWFGSSVDESDDDAIPYFLGYFQQLRSFVQAAANANKGLLVYVD